MTVDPNLIVRTSAPTFSGRLVFVVLAPRIKFLIMGTVSPRPQWVRVVITGPGPDLRDISLLRLVTFSSVPPEK